MWRRHINLFTGVFMNKLFISAVLAVGFISSIFAMESEKRTDEICFVGQSDYFVAGESSPSIKFSNLIGYKNAVDAASEKDGKVIGLVCNCLAGRHVQTFVFCEEKVSNGDWILADGSTTEHLRTIEDATGPAIDCHEAVYFHDSYLKRCLQFELDSYSPRIWIFYKRPTYRISGIIKFGDSENEFVKLAEKIVRSLLGKRSYSNADKVAASIAFDLYLFQRQP